MSKKKKLPKTFQNATVVRAQPMKSDAREALFDKYALDEFDASKPMFIVVDDRALEGCDPWADVAGFHNREAAVRFARSCGGNVDRRVLVVTEQILVVATENDL